MKKYKKTVLPILFLLISYISPAQIPQLPQPPPGGGPAGPPGLPIDENLCVLVAVAILYGTYKVYQLNKKKCLVSQSI